MCSSRLSIVYMSVIKNTARADQLLPDLRDKQGRMWQAAFVTTLVRDTHRLIVSLTDSGFSAKQAEVVADALNNLDASDLSTKSDIVGLEHKIERLELRLTIKLESLIAAGVAFLSFLRFFT